MRFKVQFMESTGSSFQDFFSEIMGMRYPSDFIPVRPWGNHGDRKNDGYLRSKRKLFQCYAPEKIELSKWIKKIREDFSGALPYWEEHFDEWVFTHNNMKGVPADIVALLLALSEKHKPLRATQWGYAEILAEFKALSSSDVATLLGPAPRMKDVVSIRVEDVGRLLEHIALQPEPLSADIKPVPEEKLNYNQLSEAVKILIRAGMTRVEIVKRYLHSLVDQVRHDRVAAAFRAHYEQLKNEGLLPDDIFVGLQRFVSSNSPPSARHQAAILTILAFFFEECEIFERPPVEIGPLL